jgi:uncharacterized protein (DUF1800 family)
VKSPIELAVGTLRSLEITNPTVSGESLAESLERMGQVPFAPPSVAGWDWGTAWFNTQSALERTNFMLALAGDDAGLGRRFDPEALATRHASDSQAARFYSDLLVQDALPSPPSAGKAREAALAILTAPEYQLA